MAKSLLHDFGVYPLSQEQRGRRVPEIVNANLSQFGFLQDALDYVPNVALLKGCPFERREHPFLTREYG